MKNLQAETVAKNLIINEFWVAMVSGFSFESIRGFTKTGVWAQKNYSK